jgi:transcriptional regulator with XRE-family HTH domain
MLGDRIKALRDAQGWTQQQLADKAKVSQQLVWKIESGQVSETKKLPSLAKAFGMTVEQLLAGRSEVREPTAPYHGIQLTRSGAMLGAEWEKLDIDDRTRLEAEILTLVAAKKRGELAGKNLRRGKKDEDRRQ